MNKLTLAVAVLASLGAGMLVQPALALPGTPMGVSAPEAVQTVQMHRMERRMMRHRMMRHRMMRHRMMRHRMMHRM